jgi:pimeloyl-ACP methyl ester carboxylesterase
MRSRPVWLILLLAALLILVVLAGPFLYLSGSRDFEQLVIPADGYELVGYLSQGTSPNGPWFVFAHGNRASGQAHPLYQRFLRNLQPEATILAIDLRGFGKSSAEGLATADRVWDRSGDFEAAVAYLKTAYQAGDERIILSGHSLGAAQALKAAQQTPYRLVIPIGLGDYDTILINEEEIRSYSDKLAEVTGAAIDPAVVRREGDLLRPAGLFSPCPLTPVVLVFGDRDDGNSVLYSQHKVPDSCEPPIRWRTVPLADHMYGTEGSRLPGPIQRYYAEISMSMLTRTVNQLLAE